MLNVSSNDRVTEVVVEAIEVLGPDATIVTRDSTARSIAIEYVEGALWESTSNLSPFQAGTTGGSVQIANPAILLWDGAIDSVDEVAGFLKVLKSEGKERIVIVARSFSGEALGLLRRNADAGMDVTPVIAPHAGKQQAWAFDDLSVMTGAEPLRPEAGHSLSRIRSEAFGIAQRVVLGPRFLNMLVPRSHQPAIDRQLETVRRLMEQEEEENVWQHHQLRLGRLHQGMGVIWVGAPTASERDVMSRMVEQSLSRLRTATKHGIVPGGGATLLAAARDVSPTLCREWNLGIRAVAHALERPAWWIARNAGYDPAAMITRGREYAPNQGLDMRTEQCVNFIEAGISDPLPTVKSAVEIGLSMAALACDCSVLVKREISLDQAELSP